MNDRKQLLVDVSIMRPILIVLLILHHAFANFAGTWDSVDGQVSIDSYAWISRICYSFMLESFVFISGYIYSYQINTQNKNEGFIALAKKKFYRLLVPCFIFSLLYALIIDNVLIDSHFPLHFIEYLFGIGHMWFLGMLFWVFLAAWPIVRIKLHTGVKIAILILANLLCVKSLPLNLHSAIFYLVFFYLGYITYIRKDFFVWKIKASHLTTIWLTYIVAFGLLAPLKQTFISMEESLNGIELALCMVGRNVVRLVYSIIGLYAFWLTTVKISLTYTISPKILWLGEYCMGIYIFQQFVLKYTYYHTNLPLIVGSYWLPWIGCVLATGFSLGLSIFIRFFKYGRKLF